VSQPDLPIATLNVKILAQMIRIEIIKLGEENAPVREPDIRAGAVSATEILLPSAEGHFVGRRHLATVVT